MNFEYNDTQAMIAQSIRDFAEQNIRPHIMEWDEAQIFPVELFKKLGEMGFMGVLVPEELGGSGLGYHEYLQFCEDAGIDAMYVFNCGMTCQGRNADYFDENLIEEFYQDAVHAILYARGLRHRLKIIEH